jgi:hypothetical protein
MCPESRRRPILYFPPRKLPDYTAYPRDRQGEPRLIGHKVSPGRFTLSLIRPELRAAPAGFRGVCNSGPDYCSSDCLRSHWKLDLPVLIFLH